MESLISLDEVLKIVQIAFYLTATTVAVLTYRSAKRGLLNTINTEYQKRVIERLKELGEELDEEFSPESPTYWARQKTTEEIVTEINRQFAANRAEILKQGNFGGGMRHTKEMRRISELLRRVRTDPFVPRSIRSIVIDLLSKRVEAFFSIHWEEFNNYRKQLAEGKHASAEELESNFGWVHNRINSRLYEQGVGISQVEEAVESVRLSIQRYLESFDPLSHSRPGRRWWWLRSHRAQTTEPPKKDA